MKPRIVVIDDDADVRLILEVRLHRAGFDVLTAAAGKSGMELVKSHHPDLVLVDLSMPGMSGFEFVCAVRKCQHAPRIYVMTDRADDQSQADVARSLGAEGLISKKEALAREFCVSLFGPSSSGEDRLRNRTSRHGEPALAA